MSNSRKHHFVAQFYQRNFANPMFSDNICIYESRTQAWSIGHRTPKGIGWFPHLYNMTAENAQRTDAFEDFLQKYVDGVAAPVMKKAACEPENLNKQERESIALFIGFALARTPEIMHSTQDDGLSKLSDNRSTELIEMAIEWCRSIGKPYTDRSLKEFLKPGLLKAVVSAALSIRDRVLQLHWSFVRTTEDEPFIISDWPVYAEHDPKSNTRSLAFR